MMRSLEFCMGINLNLDEEYVVMIIEKLQVENSVFLLVFLEIQLHSLKRNAELRAVQNCGRCRTAGVRNVFGRRERFFSAIEPDSLNLETVPIMHFVDGFSI